jgi:uncharacterized membrane protein SirB2
MGRWSGASARRSGHAKGYCNLVRSLRALSDTGLIVCGVVLFHMSKTRDKRSSGENVTEN